jgi:hypothetical protein
MHRGFFDRLRWRGDRSFEIKGVYEGDFKKYLANLKLLDKELRCFNCGKKLDVKDISSLCKHKGEIIVCCDDLICYKEMLRMLREDEK